MTAPLTPPHQPSSSSSSSSSGDGNGDGGGGGNPWRAPEAGPVPPGKPWGDGPEAAEAKRAELRRDLRDAGIVLAGVTVLGVVLGLLWLWLAPRVPLVSDGTAVFLKNTEGEESIGADGTFVLLAAGLGVLSAAAVFLFRRRGGVALVVALALGGLLASLAGWGIGVWLGPGQDVAARAREAGEGVTFDAYLQLRAKGALLAWSLTAMVTHLGLTALFAPDDPEPEHAWPAPGADQQWPPRDA